MNRGFASADRKTALAAISPDLFAVLFDGATALLPTDAWDALHTLRCSRALQHNELGEFESGTTAARLSLVPAIVIAGAAPMKEYEPDGT